MADRDYIMKDKYCACISGELVYRAYKTPEDAIRGLRKLAIKRNGNLTDISIRSTNKWSRIRWTK